MSRYLELTQQASELMRAAEAARREELKELIGDIKAAIKENGLTASDLGFAVGGKGSRPKAEAKYRDPVSGATWSGRGRSPAWITGPRENYAL